MGGGRLAAETSMIDEPTHCRECGCPARSIAAKECRASDCPLNSANRQEPAPNPYGRSLDQPLEQIPIGLLYLIG